MSENASGPAPKPRSGFSVANILLISVPALLIVVGIYWWIWREANRELDEMVNPGPAFAYSVNLPQKLDDRFADADGDLVADAPSDPAKQIDPDVLIFAPLSLDSQSEREAWEDFRVYLIKATGKKDVQFAQESIMRPDQFRALDKDGPHVLGLSTGSVVPAVNLGGFVPVCVMADANGHWGYEMEIIVPADRAISKIEDLRGKNKVVAFGNFQSHSSFKLLIVTLREAGLLYERDYSYSCTCSQAVSIEKIRNKECDAAGVASDYLKRQVAEKKISTDDYKTIYTSKASFPPACFGYVSNLKPELAEKIRKAFLEYKFAGTSLEKHYKDSDQVRFVPINYKQDWAKVREIDDRMRQIVKEKP